ncbi:MAG: glycosyltransferase [Chloroflexi bacterium]|nr:MAG: glycosyltransferase [Chloroflexota bacterium]
MAARFSVVYPTRHRPDFIRQALRILETQIHDDFEVIVCDNFVDPALSCESVCGESRLANLTYVRPPRPVGMVENWNHSLKFANGDYVLYLTDKMFVLPDAFRSIERALEATGEPEIVSWTSDFYKPASYADYFGKGFYVNVAPDAGAARHRPFEPADELDARGRAEVSRNEQSASQYCRGKLVFGAYRRDMVQRIVGRFGALFHNINPDYTSMVLGLGHARGAVELERSCVVSVNTDISNGVLCDTDDAAALRFVASLDGGVERILTNMLVPGLYASLHNWVAHDYLALREAAGLSFDFNVANWLVYCTEDIYRPGRRWSDPEVERSQKGLLRTAVESLEPAVRDELEARLAARPARPRRPVHRRVLRRVVPTAVRQWRVSRSPTISPSILAAIERAPVGQG